MKDILMLANQTPDFAVDDIVWNTFKYLCFIQITYKTYVNENVHVNCISVFFVMLVFTSACVCIAA